MIVVIPMRFERMTYCLEGSCSIQLSYGTLSICRDDKIRTCDLFVPNEARYQAALHPVIYFEFAKVLIILIGLIFLFIFFFTFANNLKYIKMSLPKVKVYFDLSAKNKLSEIVSNIHTIIILCDTNTKLYCLPLLKTLVPELESAFVWSIPQGENSKNWKTVLRFCEVLIQRNVDRNTLLINVGGGVVCDLGAFTASVFKRGIPYINIPTSLLAQVDAAIGGKTAINFKNIKNQIGTFYQPEAVFIFNEFLSTLPIRHYRAGFAEMLKHALISDKNYWNELKNIQCDKKEIFDNVVIKKSIEIKQSIVNIDFKDCNERKKLNFGHTIGHAFESLFIRNKHIIYHGEAVAWGMLVEAYLSYQKGNLSEEELNDIQRVITSIYKPIKLSLINFDSWKRFLLNDKKRISNSLNMTLLKGIGTAVINQDCSDLELNKAYKYLEKTLNS